ncbi:MAG: CRISPR-associated endonuclease Cas1 [Desulfosalsimonadaceae bacterium]|nr:CRISPR-associated endonuclease Cas1 [Desulfosalsimonadaceae bacterium]
MSFIYVTEQGAVIGKKGQRVVVSKDRETLADVPANRVQGVLVFGNVQITTQAMRLMLESGVEMALFSGSGRLLGQITSPFPKNITLRQSQYARAGDPAFVSDFAAIIVRAKIQNCLELIREFSHNHPETDLTAEKDQLESTIRSVEARPDVDSLLGLEGASARAYFSSFAKMIRTGFTFTGREKHPPPDPVNALLSLGYTMAFNEISSLLDGIGFDPFLGFFHQPRYGHAGLASDLCEEFRAPLTDRLTLYLINNRIIQPEDFQAHAPSGGVYLGHEPRKRYFEEYEKFVLRPMPVSDENESQMNIRRLFMRQAERLRHTLMTGEPYQPYLFRW